MTLSPITCLSAVFAWKPIVSCCGSLAVYGMLCGTIISRLPGVRVEHILEPILPCLACFLSPCNLFLNPLPCPLPCVMPCFAPRTAAIRKNTFTISGSSCPLLPVPEPGNPDQCNTYMLSSPNPPQST